MIRVLLPENLAKLAHCEREVEFDLSAQITRGTILDAVEARYPMLAGTIRDQQSRVRRPFIRFFACGEDLSYGPDDEPVPDAVREGRELFMVIGAMAGG